jgi:hypothetical protein
MKKIITSVYLGNVLETYDFGFVSVLQSDQTFIHIFVNKKFHAAVGINISPLNENAANAKAA